MKNTRKKKVSVDSKKSTSITLKKIIEADRKMEHDPVNNPKHYTDGKIQPIQFIEDKDMGYHLGNAVKYIARAGRKDPSKVLEDLKKAQWYLNRHISNLEKAAK